MIEQLTIFELIDLQKNGINSSVVSTYDANSVIKYLALNYIAYVKYTGIILATMIAPYFIVMFYVVYKLWCLS